MSDKAEFAERLKRAMLAAGYEARPAVLEREFNLRYWGKPITFQAVRRWLRGESIPSQDKLLVLAEWLGVEPQVMRYGEEAIGRIGERNAGWEAGIGSEESELLRLYRALPVAQRRVVRDVLEAFAEANAQAGGERAANGRGEPAS